MKRIVLILIIFVSPVFVLAQNQKAREKIEAARIALITKELNLTPDQAKLFWPTYNEFISKRNELIKKYKLEKSNFDAAAASEQERQNMLALGLELKQQKLNLEKDYSHRFLDIISSRQIIRLKGAEDKFKRLVLERIQQRREHQMRQKQDQIQKRRDDYQKRRNNN